MNLSFVQKQFQNFCASVARNAGPVSLLIVASIVVTACGSGRLKARQDQREKLANSSGMYCEWVNGDKQSDFDIELNLQMAKRCDSSKPFSIMPYKNPSDQNGILYCCAMAGADGPSGNHAPTQPRRTNGPAARRVNPAAPPQAPAATTPAATAPVPQSAPAANSDAAPSINDDIVEDK